jgi:hypothetical protein
MSRFPVSWFPYPGSDPSPGNDIASNSDPVLADSEFANGFR